MDVHHLRTLRELRDRGSVTAVAEVLRLSPSAVSQQLAVLQRSFDAPLTEQRGRVLVLTAAGERLADAGGDVIESMARAEQSVSQFLEAPAETVTVTAFHSAALAWFPELIARSLADPEGAQVRCRDEDVSIQDFLNLTADHDVVVAHRSPSSPKWPERRVRVIPVIEEPIDLALRRSHPLAAYDTIALTDLDGATWLAAHEGFALEPLIVQALAAGAGTPLEITHRVNEFNVAAAIIARTDTIGFLPRYTGLLTALKDEIVLRPIRDLSITRDIDILVRPERLARASVRVVIERILDVAREQSGAR